MELQFVIEPIVDNGKATGQGCSLSSSSSDDLSWTMSSISELMHFWSAGAATRTETEAREYSFISDQSKNNLSSRKFGK